MFSKNDYIKYFERIKAMEMKMAALYRDYTSRVDDPEVKNFFAHIQKEEEAHAKVADAMLKMFSKK